MATLKQEIFKLHTQMLNVMDVWEQEEAEASESAISTFNWEVAKAYPFGDEDFEDVASAVEDWGNSL